MVKRRGAVGFCAGLMWASALVVAATWAACGPPDAEDASAPGADVLSGAPAGADVSPAPLADVAGLHPGALRDAALRGGGASLPGAAVIGRFEGEIDPYGGESTLRFIPAESKSASLPGVGRSPRTGSQLVLEQNLDELGYSVEDCGPDYWNAKWAAEGSEWRFWLNEGAPRTAFFQRLVNGPPDSDGEDALRFCTEFTLRNISSNTYGDLWLMFDGIALERGYAFVDSVPRRLEGLGGDGTDLEYAPVSDRGMFNYGPLAPSEEVSRQWYFYRAPGSALERFRVSGDVVEILHEECGNGQDNNGDGIADSGCGLGSFEGDCYLDADCLSGACDGAVLDPDSVDAWELGACEPSPVMGACLEDTDCGGGLTCVGADPGAWDPGTCGFGLGASCTLDAQCVSGFCDMLSSECRVADGGACAAPSECGTGLTCEENVCQPLDCGGLSDPSNGTVATTGTGFGDEAMYGCDSGYDLVGPLSRTCQADGTWSGSAPTCQLVDCGSLSIPTNGSVSAPTTTFGSVASYTCNSGYNLSGNPSRTCQADGTWSGGAPTCQPVNCGGLSNPTNGSVSAPTTTFGSVASYTCNSGFVRVGDASRTCQANGTWSGTAPVCAINPITCTSDAQCPTGAWCPTNTSQRRCSPRPTVGGDQMPFQWVPSGTFTMGSPSGEVGRTASREAQVSVTLTRNYWVQRTPVTQGQWQAVMTAWNALPSGQRTMSGWSGATPVFGTTPSCYRSTSGTSCTTSGSNPTGPVERVSWWDAVVYANALSILEGLTPCYTLSGCGTGTGVAGVGGGCSGTSGSCSSGLFSCSSVSFVGKSCTGYRLLTEAEWERAARGGTTTATYNGNLTGTNCAVSEAVLNPIAWSGCNSGVRTQAVGGRTPNAWGLYDMLGNVVEWTWTWYANAHSGGTDPLGPSTGSDRVLRGGSFVNGVVDLRAASRRDEDPDLRTAIFGFRLARSTP